MPKSSAARACRSSPRITRRNTSNRSRSAPLIAKTSPLKTSPSSLRKRGHLNFAQRGHFNFAVTCGEAEREGARTAGGDDLCGQASGTVADEGAHPAEGGCVGGGRRLERQRDLGGVGHQHKQYRPHPASTGRRRDRGGADPQIQSELRPAADCRRGGGGEIDRPDLLACARGVRALELASARGEGRRIEHCREGQRQHEKNVLKPHRNRQWVIPPDANAGFVVAMEDVLDTYQKPRDSDRPLVCLDESSKQLIVETRAPIPARPGRAVRHDYEYERNG